ncbi:cysteine dioxygenase [Actinomadura sp. PM05-2]|uniref:Cysteine dioxygenase n=2 Tax=Actinomadura parmotrematis TaxID=2864039 RepID=A0ABS7G2N0_9ACTN|nr:cysteine dioxygenase [Actinomadura parmotrematis]
MRGQADPHGRAVAERPPTAGQLAARLAALAARPERWWHLARFEAGAPVRAELADPGGVRLWLTTWPPGHRSDLPGGDGTEVSALVAGELAETTLAADGVTERPLRTNRVRVHGGGDARVLANPGPAYAITLHAALPA